MAKTNKEETDLLRTEKTGSEDDLSEQSEEEGSDQKEVTDQHLNIPNQSDDKKDKKEDRLSDSGDEVKDDSPAKARITDIEVLKTNIVVRDINRDKLIKIEPTTQISDEKSLREKLPCELTELQKTWWSLQTDETLKERRAARKSRKHIKRFYRESEGVQHAGGKRMALDSPSQSMKTSVKDLRRSTGDLTGSGGGDATVGSIPALES